MKLTANQIDALRQAAERFGFPPSLETLKSLSPERKNDVKRFLTTLLMEKGLSDDDYGVNAFGRDVDDLIDIVGY